MKEYFSHDYNARNDNKLVRLFMKLGLEGVGAYWCIIEMLYEEGGYLLRTEYERISFELRTNVDFIKQVVEDFDLFKKDKKKFWSETALDRLEKRSDKSEKAKAAVNKRWSKYKRNTNVKQSKSDSNTSKVKESKGKEIKNIYNDFYDSEITKSEKSEKYIKIVKILFGDNNFGYKLDSVLKMPKQLTFDQSKKILYYKEKYNINITGILEEMENWKGLKDKKTVYQTFLTFMKNRYKEIK